MDVNGEEVCARRCRKEPKSDASTVGDPAFSSWSVTAWYGKQPKRRMPNEVQEVGGPNSTDEAVNKISGGGKSRTSCSSQLRPAGQYQRGNICCTQRQTSPYTETGERRTNKWQRNWRE